MNQYHIKLRRDFGQSDDTIRESMNTEADLSRAIWQTKQEKGGLSLQEVTEVIKGEFDESEVESLVNNLKK